MFFFAMVVSRILVAVPLHVGRPGRALHSGNGGVAHTAVGIWVESKADANIDLRPIRYSVI